MNSHIKELFVISSNNFNDPLALRLILNSSNVYLTYFSISLFKSPLSPSPCNSAKAQLENRVRMAHKNMHLPVIANT